MQPILRWHFLKIIGDALRKTVFGNGMPVQIDVLELNIHPDAAESMKSQQNELT